MDRTVTHLILFLCTLTFQLMTTEDWHNVYYTSNRPWLRQLGADYIVPIYFTSAITVGGCILPPTSSFLLQIVSW